MIRVIYHRDCKDGFAAAMAFWLSMPGATFQAATYGDKLNLNEFEAEDEVYIVDFSYPRAVLVELEEKVRRVVVLDHHKTAAADLADLKLKKYGSVVVFDMRKSGCRLAWEYLHDMPSLPPLFAYIEDRDLWRFDLDGTKEVCAGLDTLPMDFHEWRLYLKNCLELRERGQAVLAYERKIIEVAIKNMQMFEIDGHHVPAANAAWLWSEIGEALCIARPDALFSATWYVMGDGRVKWSLRSRSGFDVSAVAKKYGGGGHPGAAGMVTFREFMPSGVE